MEKRLSERVQFFQLTREEDVPPVWVFQRAHSNTILGLLLDISAAGIQILTDKLSPMQDEAYQLIVHTEEAQRVSFTSVVVRRLWSNPYGALYIPMDLYLPEPKTRQRHSIRFWLPVLLARNGCDVN